MAKNKDQYLNPERDKIEKLSMIEKVEKTISQLESFVPNLIKSDDLYEEKSDIDSKKR